MAAFWHGEISLRKLRVLLEWLPPEAPTRWHVTENRPFTMSDQLQWNATWAIAAIASMLAGKGENPLKNMPQFPWQKAKDSGQSTYGSFGDHSPEEVMDYLDSL